MTINTLLNTSCENFADNICISSKKGVLKYKDLQQYVTSCAYSLKKLGINKQDKVALILPNIEEFIISFFAILKLGAIVVPINYGYKKDEIEYIVKDATINSAITTKRIEHMLKELNLKNIILTDENFDELLRGDVECEKVSAEEEINENDIALIIYTNATSGYPLGCTLTHKNLLSNTKSCYEVTHPNENDRFLAILPLYHAFGMQATVLLPIYVGASIYLLDRFSPEQVLKIIQDNKITFGIFVPTMLGIMSLFKGYDLSSLRLCISGGAPLTENIRKKFEQNFNIKILEGYGLTEAAPTVSFNRINDNKDNSVGKPLPNVEVRIVDEEGNEKDINEVGEIIVKGENVMKGYYNKEAETKEVIKDGWLYTGDLGYKDSDGFIYITGVKKKMLLVGGFNVYEEELKRVISAHPKVKEVKVAAIEDELFYQFPKVEVVAEKGLTEEELKSYCNEKLASYKRPKEIKIRRGDEK